MDTNRKGLQLAFPFHQTESGLCYHSIVDCLQHLLDGSCVWGTIYVLHIVGCQAIQWQHHFLQH